MDARPWTDDLRGYYGDTTVMEETKAVSLCRCGSYTPVGECEACRDSQESRPAGAGWIVLMFLLVVGLAANVACAWSWIARIWR